MFSVVAKKAPIHLFDRSIGTLTSFFSQEKWPVKTVISLVKWVSGSSERDVKQKQVIFDQASHTKIFHERGLWYQKTFNYKKTCLALTMEKGMGEWSGPINGGVIEGKVLAPFYLFKKHFYGVQCMAWARDFPSHKHPDLLWSTSTLLFRAFPKVLPLQIQWPGHEIDHSPPFLNRMMLNYMGGEFHLDFKH